MNYSSLIKYIREKKGLNQAELAEICKCTQAYVSNLENGKNKMPNIEFLSALVLRLNVNPFSFFIEGYKPVFVQDTGTENNQLRAKISLYERKISEIIDIMNGKHDKPKKTKITSTKK